MISIVINIYILFTFGIILLLISFFDNVIFSNFLWSVENRISTSLLVSFIVLSGVNIGCQSFLLYSLKKYAFNFKTKIVNISISLLVSAIVFLIVFLSIIILQMIFLKSYEFF